MTRISQMKPDWTELSEDLIGELKRRSAVRVEQSEDFAEITEQLAKRAARGDVIHLAELIREREEAEDETSENADATDEGKDANLVFYDGDPFEPAVELLIDVALDLFPFSPERCEDHRLDDQHDVGAAGVMRADLCPCVRIK